MPFLHGFRRIIFEYQPLVDEILGALGIQDPEQPVAADTRSRYWSLIISKRLEYHAIGGLESRVFSAFSFLVGESEEFLALNELLERHSQSSFYKEGVSYSLLKVAELGMVPSAKILLQFGADLSFEDPVTYYTALHIAVLRNQPEMVELLVQSGADINKRDRIHESSPLDLASEEPERLPCLQRLLELSADVNAADKNGADVKATTKDYDTVFSCIIFLLGETVGCDQEEAKLINHFCFRVSQLLIAHGADPSECPSHESLTHTCLKSFKLHFPLLRFLLESGASYNCSQHGPSCWSGFHIVLERLCSYLGTCDECDSLQLLQKAECALDLMIAHSPQVKLPRNFEINTAGCNTHVDKVVALLQSLKQLEHSPPTLKHLCRVFIRQRLRPWPVDVKVKALPLPDRLKWYLLINHSSLSSNEEDL
uniref:Ankyrin repeat and SOCS box-containing 6 n=1 Tax=Xenopus tropicalis TaxID=8364 RepID=A0A803JCR5_XENTR